MSDDFDHRCRRSIAEALLEGLPETAFPAGVPTRDDICPVDPGGSRLFTRYARESDLIQQRLGQDNESTTGILMLNRDLRVRKRGEVLCYTLEDLFRAVKIDGRTRFSAGAYELEKVTESGILNSMRRWFPEMDFIVGIKDVPEFDLLRYHTGVRHQHSRGCPLMAGSALNSWKTSNEEAALAQSRECYKAVHLEVFRPLFDVNPTPRVWVRDEDFLLR